jgi:heme-degrading monooxygenase HmoA
MKTIEVQPDSPDTQPALSRRLLLEGSVFGALTLVAHSALAQRSPRNSQVDITIHANGQMVSLINVCTVDPQDQQTLIDIFKEGTEAWISKVPGYISTSLHKSTDGRRVVIYSQWAERAKHRQLARQCRHGSVYETHQRIGDSGQHDL